MCYIKAKATGGTNTSCLLSSTSTFKIDFQILQYNENVHLHYRQIKMAEIFPSYLIINGIIQNSLKITFYENEIFC